MNLRFFPVRLFLAIAIAAGSLAMTVRATTVQAAGDAAGGRTLARHWCAACHDVERRAAGAVIDSAPSFVVVANTPGRTAGQLRAFLSNPHPPMPNLSLTRAEIDDFVAYILSLRKPD